MKNKLFRKDFTLVVIGQIISIFGAAILRFALNLYVLDITGRVDIFAWVLALSVIPGIIFGPVGGAVADRVNRRNLMVLFDFSSSGVVLLLFFLLSTHRASVAAITCIMAVLYTISSLYQPAVQASIPTLVQEEQLASANGIVSSVNAIANLAAPVLGGILYGMAGLHLLVAISSMAFFLSAVMEIFIQIPFLKTARSKGILPTILGDMKTGMGYIVKENPKIFRTILLAAAVNMLTTPLIIVAVPYILRNTLNSNETMYGMGMGFAQLSMIVGAMLTGVLMKKMTLSKIYRGFVLLALLIVPMAVAVTPWVTRWGYWPPFALFCLSSALVMMLCTVISILFMTIVQRETPNELLGKVMALIMTVAQCAAPVGQAFYGIALEHWKQTVFIPVLLAAVLTAVIAFLTKWVLGETE